MVLAGSWEIDYKPIPEQLFSLSTAYLESAIVLCEWLIHSPKELTFDRGRVVIALGRHSAELFLKAAILKRDFTAKLHHDLEDLKADYDRLYPGKTFIFEMPFKTEILGFDDEDEANEQLRQLKKRMPHDQLFRYPMDKAKKGWQGALGFDPETFIDTLYRLRGDYERLGLLLFEGQLSED